MNSRWERFQAAAAVLLLAVLIFCAWYFMFYLPGKASEPEGILICLPEGSRRL